MSANGGSAEMHRMSLCSGESFADSFSGGHRAGQETAMYPDVLQKHIGQLGCRSFIRYPAGITQPSTRAFRE